jgi:hypothetical protein
MIVLLDNVNARVLKDEVGVACTVSISKKRSLFLDFAVEWLDFEEGTEPRSQLALELARNRGDDDDGVGVLQRKYVIGMR